MWAPPYRLTWAPHMLQALDEPAAKQSDPTLLNLQLRQLAKDRPAGSARQADAIGRIQRSDAAADKRIDQWIASVAELSRGRPGAGGGGYRKPLPDVEALMQEWPAEVEAQLRARPLPGGHMVRGGAAAGCKMRCSGGACS
jgi:intraflagellar transport protein 46